MGAKNFDDLKPTKMVNFNFHISPNSMDMLNMLKDELYINNKAEFARSAVNIALAQVLTAREVHRRYVREKELFKKESPRGGIMGGGVN